MARNVDIKLQFAEYDGTPGLGARNFRKNLILTLSSTDDHGYSLADCLLRCDQGACTRASRTSTPASYYQAAVTGTATL